MVGLLKVGRGQVIVRLTQGIWCDTGKHLIPKGEEYVHLPSGRLSCPKHQEDETLMETQKAGSLT